MATKTARPSVFLNIPYDPRFQHLFLAYISAIAAFNLAPRAVLEIPGGERRLDRIQDLIGECRYSIHDLSWVQLDRRPPTTPRFNMPFELGLVVARERLSGTDHEWFVCEKEPYRLQKSLSDLNGTDPYIHHGTVAGVLGQLANAFARLDRHPTTGQMQATYRKLRKQLPTLIHDAGAGSAFEARVFKDLCVLASAAAEMFVV